MHNGNDTMKSWAVVRLVHLALSSLSIFLCGRQGQTFSSYSRFLFSFVRGKVMAVTLEHVVVSHSEDDESQLS